MTKIALDPVIHAPNRLQICAFLAPLEEAEFQVLREELEVSESVLSKHISRLVEAEYVSIRKSPVNGRQRKWASLTDKGRTAFFSHVANLQRIVAGAADLTSG